MGSRTETPKTDHYEVLMFRKMEESEKRRAERKMKEEEEEMMRGEGRKMGENWKM